MLATGAVPQEDLYDVERICDPATGLQIPDKGFWAGDLARRVSSDSVVLS
jgi:hypothetical protein